LRGRRRFRFRDLNRNRSWNQLFDFLDEGLRILYDRLEENDVDR
jgi:hypothetical protein